MIFNRNRNVSQQLDPLNFNESLKSCCSTAGIGHEILTNHYTTSLSAI